LSFQKGASQLTFLLSFPICLGSCYLALLEGTTYLP
jgi:undecaprenyl pyrophosphate phosphatase UppP